MDCVNGQGDSSFLDLGRHSVGGGVRGGGRGVDVGVDQTHKKCPARCYVRRDVKSRYRTKGDNLQVH